MKRLIPLLLLLAGLLAGCSGREPPAQVAATTLPVYEFTLRIAEGTGISVARLVTEQVSCLHDYSLNVRQVKAVEAADVVVLSGAGLEDFMGGLLAGAPVIDASAGIDLLCGQEEHESHAQEGHHHEEDPHIWLSPENAKAMAQNICAGLSARYPEHRDAFSENLGGLLGDLDALEAYGKEHLADLNCREMIPFHDGFSYFAREFQLDILKAVEEEAGQEASARELIELIALVEGHRLPAVFTEKSGSGSAASIIARETGCAVFELDMAMAGDSYFAAMYHNIDIIKEALG